MRGGTSSVTAGSASASNLSAYSNRRLASLRARAKRRAADAPAYEDTPEQLAQAAETMAWAMPLQLEVLARMDREESFALRVLPWLRCMWIGQP